MSETKRLRRLARNYQKLIDRAAHGGLDADEAQQITEQRSFVYDQIIAEFGRLGVTIADRQDAAQQALALAARRSP